jgi:hypothetical protein
MSLILLTVLVVPFGIWLAADGLSIRLFAVPLPVEGILSTWRLLPSALHLPPAAFGWPLVVLGTAWFGALVGLWFRLGWSRRAALVLAAISLLHLGLGTVTGVLALVSLADRRLRAWLATPIG